MNKFLSDVKKYKSYIFYAAKSELKSEVANSFLNWLWWILEPLCFMGIYAFVFFFFFKGGVQHLTAFIFIGITMWEFFNKMLKCSVKLVRSSKPIVSKIYVPKYVLVLEKMALNAFKTLINFAVVVLLMFIDPVTPTLHVLWAIPVMLSFVIFTFGICCIFLHFGVFIEDLVNITDISLRLLFYATGIFYNIADRITGILGYVLVRVNPVAMYISSMRNCLLYGGAPYWKWLIVWSVVGLLLSYIGIRLIQKNENSYVKVI